MCCQAAAPFKLVLVAPFELAQGLQLISPSTRPRQSQEDDVGVQRPARDGCSGCPRARQSKCDSQPVEDHHVGSVRAVMNADCPAPMPSPWARGQARARVPMSCDDAAPFELALVAPLELAQVLQLISPIHGPGSRQGPEPPCAAKLPRLSNSCS